MSNNTFKISEVNFINPGGNKDCFLVACLSLFLSLEEFCKTFDEFRLKCRTNSNHYCLTCGFKEIIDEINRSKTANIARLRSHLANSIKDKEIFEENLNCDVMEAVSVQK